MTHKFVHTLFHQLRLISERSFQESNLPHENTVKEIIQERPIGRHRKKWQVRCGEC